MLLKRLLKSFLKSNDILFKFHLRMVIPKTIFKNLEQQLLARLLSSNLTYVPHILNFAKILKGEIERLTKMVTSIEH